MEQDNSQLNDLVFAKVAKLVGVEVPKGLSKKDKQLAVGLEALSGSQFDEAYIKAVTKVYTNPLASHSGFL